MASLRSARAALAALVMPLAAASACGPAPAPEDASASGPSGGRAPLQVATSASACPEGRTFRNGECVLIQPEDAIPTAINPSAFKVDPRDPRTGRPPRSPSLVATELQQLKRLLEVTPETSPEVPLILRRIAEDYAELARGTSGAFRENARKGAIESYTRLMRTHPSYCEKPPSKRCADEALYFIGIEHQELGELTKARQTFFELIKNYPQSEYVPHAYFAFGEMFLEGARTDLAKLPMAQQLYEKVLQFTESPIAPYALLRLGEIAELSGDKEEAFRKYKTLRERHPGTDAAERVPDWAR